MKKEYVNPKTLFNSSQYGFSQVVISDPGRHVFISGQTAWDEKQSLVGKNDLGKQTQKSCENLKLAIEAAGGNLSDIVMLRIYKVNYEQGDGQIISEALRSAFGAQNFPASTWINVKGLASPGFLIEIEAQAII